MKLPWKRRRRRPRLEVVLGPGGRGTVTLGGRDISHVVSRITLSATPGERTVELALIPKEVRLVTYVATGEDGVTRENVRHFTV